MAGLALVVALFVLAGCPISPRGDEGPVPVTGAIEQHSELFVAEAESPETVRFETNDARYWGPYGYTLWTLRPAAQSPFVSREVTAAKESGDAAAGFGVVFCAYDSGDPLIGETMLLVMINTQREYIVGEVSGGAFRELVPWTACAWLKLGYGQENTIALSADSGEIALSLNGREVTRFRDEDPPLHDGGADGYLVVISPLDRFPDVPVRVLFREAP
jgi:hypothetical protein